MPRKSKEEHIEDFISKHGNRYDYSKYEHVSVNKKAKVICKTHGEFWILPLHHKKGVGCPKCVGKSFTTEDIIKSFKEKHGAKYDYSLVEYKSNSDKVAIICPEHGIFYQTPRNHKNGVNCPICAKHQVANNHRSNWYDVLSLFRKRHGNKFDYSKSNFVAKNKPITIICPVHGEFDSTPNAHLKSIFGCGKCFGRNKTTEDIVEEFVNVHGQKYDYSEVEFKGVKTDVKIKCKKHGVFYQTPENHILDKKGCYLCGRENSSINNTKKQHDVIKKFVEVHGTEYDYSLVEYKKMKKNVKIICKTHGEFLQSPASHISGRGCPICKSSQGEKKINSTLLSMAISFKRQQSFEWTRSNNNGFYKYDFYLPEHNLIIEYHGIQHYEHVPFFHKTYSVFQEKQKVDNKKQELAEKNGLHYLIISYKDFKNIESILHTYLDL